MPLLIRIGLTYVTLVVACIAAAQQLAHVARQPTFAFRSGDGLYWLRGYRDFPLPALLSGGGPSPGEAEVVDLRGHVLDRSHFDDVESIQDVAWGRYRVEFVYEKDGRTFRTSLDLAQ